MFAWFEKRSWLCWMITLSIAVIIFYVSSLTFEGPEAGSNLKSIIYHIFVFFFFAFFLFMGLVKGKKKAFLVVGFLVAFAYGVSDELHQIFVPGRFGSVGDVLLDGFGIIFAFMFYLISLVYRENGFRR